MNSKISINGYDLLGNDGTDGIRYAWAYENSKFLLESAAFNNRTKGIKESISGYTTSVSLGCLLRVTGEQCKFCRTGNVIPFVDLLTAKDIAKQNIFMVLSDMNCSDNEKIHLNQREFAYMGQGEPGYSYAQIRLAIMLTDYVMKKINQQVCRHIIATSGITDMLFALRDDLKNSIFSNRVTVHFSLHLVENRNRIMPIDSKYPFLDSLNVLYDIYHITGDKPCVGILLLNNYLPNGCNVSYSNNLSNVSSVLSMLDPNKVRLSFSEYNTSSDTGKSECFPSDLADAIIELSIEKGFEVKRFSSYGKSEQSACGMLGGKIPSKQFNEKWRKLEMTVDELLREAYSAL
jgi:adenine C2-methylase RlmN of 23S rRNA A2503 and tRNA A37